MSRAIVSSVQPVSGQLGSPEVDDQGGGWILVQPSGGLCNRLRVLISALILAERMARRTRLLWMPRHNCNCKFSDLFAPSPLIEVEPFWYAKGAEWLGAAPFRGVDLSKVTVLHEKTVAEMGYTIDAQSLVKQRFVLFKNCYSDFIVNDISPDEYATKVSYYLTQLAPHRKVAKKLFPLSPHTIGVHVRRTDNNVAIEKSRLEDFLELMKACLLERPDASFFLATDDPQVESTLKAAFPGKIATHPKSAYSRAQTTAIQDALVDLLMLSRCQKILGSFYSSFSEYASLFHRIELFKTGIGVWEGPAYEIRQRIHLKL
jgi:hypothetical protein